MSLNLSTSSSLDDTFRIHRESLSNRIKSTCHRTSIKHSHRSPPQPVIFMISDRDEAYSERTLTPPTNGQPILIGRAAVIDKQKISISTQPAPDNARFTCPVMSKTHAQITWKNNLPYLQDTKSTHGTWYRGEHDLLKSGPRAQTSSLNTPRASWERIPPILQLQDGMSIRFGRAITNPSSGSRYTPLEVTVRIPKPTNVSQSGTYGLIDPYSTFSDDSESEKPRTTSLPKTSITNMKKGFPQTQAPDHSRPAATETDTSLKVDHVEATSQTSDPPAASNFLLPATGNGKPLRHKIPSSQASSTDTLGSSVKPNVFSAVMAKVPTSSDQPPGSQLLPRAAPSDHPPGAVDQTLHERIPSSKSSIKEVPRSPVKSRIGQAGATGHQSLHQQATESNTSSSYSYPNRCPSSSNSIHVANPSIISSFSPAKSSPKKASFGSLHSNNRASKSRVGSDKGEEPDDRKLAGNIRVCAKRLNIKKVNTHATELLDDTEQEHGNNSEAHVAHYKQSNDLETRGQILARENEAGERDSGIGEIDCDSNRTGSDSEENSSHMDEEPDREDEDSDLESKSSYIEEESSNHVDGGDIDEEQDEFEEADSDVDSSAVYERNASEMTDDEPANDSVDHVEFVGPSKDLQNSGKDERSRSHTQEDDKVNLSSAEEFPSSLPSPRRNKDSIVNITKKTASSKTFRDMSVVTTITSKTHFTEPLNRLPENSVQVSFKLEPICLSGLGSILTEDHVSSRMPLDPIVPRKSPKIASLVEPKTQDALESASMEKPKLEGHGRLVPIVDETVCTSSRLKRKRSTESVGHGAETEKNVIAHKKKLIKKSAAGGAVCSHCSNELPQPKKQKLSAHVLSAARSLFIFALGGAATVAGILAFENIIEEI